ncbi:hypothetical protein [Methylobacterium sp. J-090]|nr:hypothetical protein [Methylobacterium sp. J-090]MCJ2081003.1 hypothetical protein [Methylobacterium sp. J-090]
MTTTDTIIEAAKAVARAELAAHRARVKAAQEAAALTAEAEIERGDPGAT